MKIIIVLICLLFYFGKALCQESDLVDNDKQISIFLETEAGINKFMRGDYSLSYIGAPSIINKPFYFYSIGFGIEKVKSKSVYVFGLSYLMLGTKEIQISTDNSEMEALRNKSYSNFISFKFKYIYQFKRLYSGVGLSTDFFIIRKDINYLSDNITYNNRMHWGSLDWGGDFLNRIRPSCSIEIGIKIKRREKEKASLGFVSKYLLGSSFWSNGLGFKYFLN